jgi:hypothetical protein
MIIDLGKIIGSAWDKALETAAIAAFSFLAGRLWKSLLKPWIESSWYSGVRLAPHYVGEFVFNGRTLNDLIEVRQRAGHVQGTMTLAAGRQGVYKFDATIVADVIRGTYEGTRTNPHTHGAFLLTIVGRDLKGRFIEAVDGKVIEAAYHWKPKDQ